MTARAGAHRAPQQSQWRLLRIVKIIFIHDGYDAVGINDLLVAAFRTTCQHSRHGLLAIGFGHHFDSGATFAHPCCCRRDHTGRRNLFPSCAMSQ